MERMDDKKRKFKNKEKIKTFIHNTIEDKEEMDHFEHFDDDVLLEMALHYPNHLKKMCMLISLDQQLEKERYEKYKNRCNRGDVC
tara:strand:- start:9433 stop:9687 length:255 start_codon:yes stop_codon:yes gene_type:complete